MNVQHHSPISRCPQGADNFLGQRPAGAAGAKHLRRPGKPGLGHSGRLVAALLAAMLLMLFAAPALANAGPPPPAVWFYLDDPSGAAPRLQGAQLLGCYDAACTHPALLQQFGVCQGAACLGEQAKSPRKNAAWGDQFSGHQLTCDARRCYSSSYRYGYLFFRLVLQFSDQARTHSQALPLPQQIMQTDAWQVTVRPDELALQPSPVQPLPGRLAPPFWLGLALTQAVELAVAALYLAVVMPRLRRRGAPLEAAASPEPGAPPEEPPAQASDQAEMLAAQEAAGRPPQESPAQAEARANAERIAAEMIAAQEAAGEPLEGAPAQAATPLAGDAASARENAGRIVAEMIAAQSGHAAASPPGLLPTLGKIFLINLLTFPAVWGFFPALRSFAQGGERSAAWALLLFTWALAFLLGLLFNLRRRAWRVGLGVLIALAIPSGLFCLLLFAFSTGYGYQGYTGPGLDPAVILLLAEMYAVAMEALLLWWYTQARLVWRHALALSLLMNLASFVAGWLLLVNNPLL
jgi:hypothetical protein